MSVEANAELSQDLGAPSILAARIELGDSDHTYHTGGSVWVPGNSRGASIFGHGVEPRVAWPMHPRSVVHSVLTHPIFVGGVRA